MTKSNAVPVCGTESRKRARAVACFLVTGCLFLTSGVGTANAVTPKVEQMLGFRPRQEGVVYTTPTAEEQADCKVELVKGAQRGSGWLLKDRDGKPLRRFFDSNDDNHIDIWSYYKDGQEVYAEIDTTFAGKPNQYRWYNAGGMRWGIDDERDGHIKAWKRISPEEVSQEVLRAVTRRDYARLEALMLSDAEMKALDLPEAEAKRYRDQIKAAPARFQETAGKVSSRATWIHLETTVPQCLPAEQTGSRTDLIKHARATILFEAEGKNDFLQIGEVIQVGNAWRIVTAPWLGAALADSKAGIPEGNAVLDNNPELQKLVEQLTAHDKTVPSGADPGPNEALVKHHLQRADLLEQIIGKVKPDQRDPWIRQVADSLSTAAQSSPASQNEAYNRLLSVEKQIVAAVPGSNLAAYVTFREMQADYARKIGSGGDYTKVQKEWIERLAQFVQTYPNGEDTADVLLQLGMVNELLSKEVEAKNWYSQLVRRFGNKPQAAKAAGAIRRLGIEGKPMKIVGPLLSDPNTQFDLEQLRGKMVVVYYWAAFNEKAASDFGKLKLLLDMYGSKGVEVVAINVDNEPDAARKFLQGTPAPGTHLFQAKGLEGKLAVDYGIQALPSLFLIGKDGRVLSSKIQINGLEDEVKKQVGK